MRVSLAEAVLLLQQGEVVAMPTETVYGLAADASNPAAIEKIFATKQRPANNPLIVHLADVQQLNNWASEFPPIAQRLAHAFWPGPLTLVLPALEQVLPAVRAHQPTVALRVPAHPIARQLIQESGLALAAPSANKYTQLSPTTATHVEDGLGAALPVIDGGPCTVGIESTIVSVSGDEWQLLRHGMILEAEIAAIAGKPALPLHILSPKAPGQHLLHYSPRTPCLLFNNRESLENYAQSHPQSAALLFGAPCQPALHGSIVLPANANDAASQLYAALHQLDQLHAEQILIETPFTEPAWLAIQDRLQRAAYRQDSTKL